MLAHFVAVSQQGGEAGRAIRLAQEKETMMVSLRIQRENQIQKERLDYFDAKHEEFKEEAIANEKIRKAEWKTKQFEYMETNLAKKIKRRTKH